MLMIVNQTMKGSHRISENDHHLYTCNKIDCDVLSANNQVLTSYKGHVRSPNFPNGYLQNGDVYTWVIKNKAYSKILVVFDDWHITPFSGEVYVSIHSVGRFV